MRQAAAGPAALAAAGTGADELRQAYRELAEARRARWQRLAQRLGVPLLPLSTQEDLVEQLRDLLEQHQPGYRA